MGFFNPLYYQNRLRHFEYLQILDEEGLKIDTDESEIDERAMRDLQQIKTSSRYSGIPHKELAILTSYIVCSKKPIFTEIGPINEFAYN